MKNIVLETIAPFSIQTPRPVLLCLLLCFFLAACDSVDEHMIAQDSEDLFTENGVSYRAEEGSVLFQVGDELIVRGVNANPGVRITTAEPNRNDVIFRPVRIQKDGLFSIELIGRDDTGLEKTLARFHHQGITDQTKQLNADFSGMSPRSVSVEFLDNGISVFQEENIPMDRTTGFSLPIGMTAGEPTSFHYVYEVDEFGNVTRMIVLDYEDEGGEKRGLSAGYANVELAFGKGETIKCTHIRFIPNSLSSKLVSLTGVRMLGSDVSDFAFLME